MASAPRLYIETLNEMIDAQSVRIAALNNRVPNAVLSLELGGAAIALALLAFYLAILHRSTAPVLLAAALVTLLLLVTFDSTDRPAASSRFPTRHSRAFAHRWGSLRPHPPRLAPDERLLLLTELDQKSCGAGRTASDRAVAPRLLPPRRRPRGSPGWRRCRAR